MNKLSDLSNEDLLKYYSLYKNMLSVNSRAEDIKKHSYSTKFAYHIIRLLDEVEQILSLGDIDLQRAREMMKSVRRGEWKEKEIHDYFAEKEKTLEQLYRESKLPHSPDESKIKSLLLECLEMHYGSLSDCVQLTNIDVNTILDEIETNIAKLRRNLNA